MYVAFKCNAPRLSVPPQFAASSTTSRVFHSIPKSIKLKFPSLKKLPFNVFIQLHVIECIAFVTLQLCLAVLPQLAGICSIRSTHPEHELVPIQRVMNLLDGFVRSLCQLFE
mmetsp:Transcript_21340/g.59321  ORF Transcript_21340/g.59321 Transcript_21340/m.59321 type:complete len:112 (-) Transcript_21340:151-486(-)